MDNGVRLVALAVAVIAVAACAGEPAADPTDPTAPTVAASPPSPSAAPAVTEQALPSDPLQAKAVKGTRAAIAIVDRAINAAGGDAMAASRACLDAYEPFTIRWLKAHGDMGWAYDDDSLQEEFDDEADVITDALGDCIDGKPRAVEKLQAARDDFAVTASYLTDQ